MNDKKPIPEEERHCENCGNREASFVPARLYQGKGSHPCAGCIQTRLRNWKPRKE